MPRHQHGGGSPGDVLAKLMALDEKWQSMNVRRVEETLELLEKEQKVWNWQNDLWCLPG